MNLKKFLKPDWRKIVIIVIILLLTMFYNTRTEPIQYGAKFYQGFPVEWWSYKRSGGSTGYELFFGELIPIGFVIDIIFWYFLSCFIVWIYDKFRKVKKK